MGYDVAIIGGGFAGLTVANRALQHGLAPVVLEAGADEIYPCNSRVSTGAVHIAFRSPEAPADELYAAIFEAAGGAPREDLARALAERARATLDWLREMGAGFEVHPRRVMGAPMLTPHRAMTAGLDWEASGPHLFHRTLEGKLPDGTVRRSCRVVRILTGDGGAVGVEIEGDERIEARAVVVCDGGFQADLGLLGAHVCRAPEKLMQRNTGSGRGDGLRMATAIGAAAAGLERFYGHLLSRDAMTKPGLWPYPQVDVVCARGIVVTPDGRRFADEGLGGIYMANAVAALDDPLSATAVFDASVWHAAQDEDIVPPNPALPDAGGTVLEADTLEELAAKAGLDAAGLAATVDGFNAWLDGRKETAPAPARSLDAWEALPIQMPPFYAIPLCAGITVTSGGLAVDGSARVLDGAGAPISGLYAAGSTVGGIEGGPKAGYVGGLIKAFGIGLIAADAIAAG